MNRDVIKSGRKRRKINQELRAYMGAGGLKARSRNRRLLAAGIGGKSKNKAPAS